MVKNFYIFILCLCCVTVYGQNQDIAESLSKRAIKINNSPLDIFDVVTLNNGDWTSLFQISEHPAFDILLNKEKEKEILREINVRRKEIRKDTLLTSDVFYILKPYFTWLHYQDPHYRIKYLWGAKDPRKEEYKVRTPTFTYLCINDTLIIDESFNPLVKKGDMLLSLNNIEISKYLLSYYTDRYNNPFELMRSHYFNYVSDTISIDLQRDKNIINIKVPTIKLIDWYKLTEWNYNIQIFPEAKSGYINIGEFFQDNNKLIKTLQTSIKGFKKKGYNNVILDLRKNPGGSGDSFDKLMSIFINKPVVQYQKSAKLKVSKETLQDYDFLTEDMIGQLVNIPEDEITKEFKTIPKMYIDGINYYVLVSENTGSTAATFVNILQYNNAAKLVGEPLLHNALKFGEVINGGILTGVGFTPTLLSSTAISTVEYDEYTKAIDGVIMPDIHIPYVARDYLSGKDAMLEKLLDILKQNTKN